VRVFRKKFSGDAAAEFGVFGFVDNTHAAAAKFAEDFVMGDGFVEHGRGANEMVDGRGIGSIGSGKGSSLVPTTVMCREG